jgi:hypothetical protein
MIITIPKIRFIVGIPYLIFIGFAGGNILYEAIVLGIVCAIVDFIIESE